ncbi:hypothetical protein V6N13_022061 [Hibiscus sabdariffa]
MKISWLKERLWRGCLLEVRHRFFQSEPDWFWSDVEDDGGGWRQRQRKLRLIGCQRLLNSHLVSLPLPVFPLWIHISKRFISDKTKNLNEIQLARRWKTLSSRGSVRSSDSILFGQANLDVLSYSEPLTHQHGFSLFISGFVDATIVYGKQNKWSVQGIKNFWLSVLRPLVESIHVKVSEIGVISFEDGFIDRRFFTCSALLPSISKQGRLNETSFCLKATGRIRLLICLGPQQQ